MLDITVVEPGLSLGCSGGALELRRDGTVLDHIPVHRIGSLTLALGQSISTHALAALADHGVPVLVQDGAARPAAILKTPHPSSSAALTRVQARGMETPSGFAIAQALVAAKLHHQARLQAAWAKVASEGQRAALLALKVDLLEQVRLVPTVQDRPTLMVLEAQGGRLHWAGFSRMVPRFPGRRYPHAADSMNLCLNYGYAVLARHWLNITLQAGLDPHLGVLHADRAGRPSLVLDLMEPWRPWVDRTVVGLVRQGVALPSQGSELSLEARKRLLQALHRTFSAHLAGGLTLRAAWLRNTRQLARHLLGLGAWTPLLARL